MDSKKAERTKEVIFKLFRRRKKPTEYRPPKESFEGPVKYRFTFVGNGDSYYNGCVVKISDGISSFNKAYSIACQVFIHLCLKRTNEDHIDNVAVFYGDYEAPESEDRLIAAYASFCPRKKFKAKK